MILITGAAGFIGSNLAAALEAQQPLVLCDWLGTGAQWKNIAKRQFYDFITPPQLLRYVDEHQERITAIIHLGAISTTTETDVDAILANNYQLSRALWQACTRYGIRFMYASSAATYGNGQHGFDDNLALADLARLHPLNAYGWSKLAFDKFVGGELAAERPSPPQYAGLRFFNVYGANEYHKGGQQSVAVQLFHQQASGEPMRLFKSYHPDYADGGQLRDFVHVDDCVDVMKWLLANPAASGLFNVGSGVARSFNDVAASVASAVGKPLNVAYTDMPPAIRAHYQYFTKASLDNLRNAGYITPTITLEDGVRRYVQNFLQSPDSYR